MTSADLDQIEALAELLAAANRHAAVLVGILDFVASGAHPAADLTREARMGSAELERVRARLATLSRGLPKPPPPFVQVGDALPEEIKQQVKQIEAKRR